MEPNDTVLRMLQDEGLTVSEIARSLKLSWHDILDICSKNGINNPTLQ